MRAAWIRLVSKLALFVFILFFGDVLLVSAETTFLANFNNSDGLSGNAQFSPDFQIGNTFTVSTRSTAAGETVDLPSGSAPNLSLVKRVFTGASSLDIHGGRDGLFYTNLASGSVSRREGTAEGFFLTPYSLLGIQNRERSYRVGSHSRTAPGGISRSARLGIGLLQISVTTAPTQPERFQSKVFRSLPRSGNRISGTMSLSPGMPLPVLSSSLQTDGSSAGPPAASRDFRH